jgi:DNA replication protein DnaC
VSATPVPATPAPAARPGRRTHPAAPTAAGDPVAPRAPAAAEPEVRPGSTADIADLTESAALKAQLQRLGLHTVAAHFEAEADRAAKSESSYTAYLARLVEAELADKVDRSVQARITRARFPMLRTLEQFDFAFQPGLSAARVRELATLAFLDQAANALLVGGPGVGKTHLAIALGLRVCAARRSVLFCPAPQLLDQLAAAEASRTLGGLLVQLRRLDLLIVDELGYLPMDGHRANLFFQLVATRYTKGSLVITTNVAFEAWGKLFGDDVLASAILDRLLHLSHIFAINGPSYRLKGKFPPTGTAAGDDDDVLEPDPKA